MKLGIFLPNWVGDAVMATPTLRALRKQFPQARFGTKVSPSSLFQSKLLTVRL